MPFQSEKQRKYLWANEPAIARDWTDKYGSRVKKDTGGITRIPLGEGSFLTGQHFGDEGNRQKLINAMERGLITEKEYKIMSGYDASREMGLTPYQTLQASGIYNAAKRVRNPQDFEGRISPLVSTLLNAAGSANLPKFTGYGFDKDKYSGILELSREALGENPYGAGLGLDSQHAQRAGLAPAYDFDIPAGVYDGPPRNVENSSPQNQALIQDFDGVNFSASDKPLEDFIGNLTGYDYNEIDALTADEQAQLSIDDLTPQRNIFGKAKDLASSGIVYAKSGAKFLGDMFRGSPEQRARNEANKRFGVGDIYGYGMGSASGANKDAFGYNTVSAKGNYEKHMRDTVARLQGRTFKPGSYQFNKFRDYSKNIATIDRPNEAAVAQANKVAAFQDQRAADTGAGSWGTGQEAESFGENIGSGGWDSYT